LNSITIKNKFPMPLIDEILNELAGAQYFTKLNFKYGFHQVRMSPSDEFKTAFKTHRISRRRRVERWREEWRRVLIFRLGNVGLCHELGCGSCYRPGGAM
jgi:hypothetical protein